MEPQRIRPKIVNTNSSNGRAVRNNNANTPAAGSSVKPTVKNSGKNAGTDQSPLEPIVEKPRKRRGLAALAIILFILLLGAAGTSYYFYNKDKADTSDLKTQKANLQNQVNQLQNANKQQTQAAAASSDYYQIKEWEVEFKPGNLNDLVYFVGKNGVDNTPVALFDSKSILAADYLTGNTCDLSTAPLGSLTQYSVAQVASGAQHDPHISNAEAQTAIKIGNYEYIFRTNTTACSKDATTNKLQTQQAATLQTAMKTLQAIPSQ